MFKTLTLVGTMLAFAGGALAAEVDGPELEWDISLWGKKRAFSAGVEKLSELVAEKTGGNWSIVIHYGEALSKSRENLDGLASDAFEVPMFCNYYHTEQNLDLMTLPMPFFPFSEWEYSRQIRNNDLNHVAVKKELAAWNAPIL